MSAYGWHRLLMRFAFAAAHVFAWIGVCAIYYQTTRSVESALIHTCLLYALSHVLSVLVVPLAARTLRHGTRRALVVGTLTAATAFAALSYGFFGTTDVLLFCMSAFAVLMGCYRALYFTPYVLTDEHHHIRYLEILLALAPAGAGMLIALYLYSPAVLFACTAALIALSVLPALHIPVRYEGFSWRYRETFHELAAAKHRRLFAVAFADGIEATALLLVWPILIWTLVPFTKLGVVISLTLLLTLIAREILRRLSWQPKPLVAAFVQVSAWVLRLSAGGALAVVLIDTYGRGAAHDGQRGIDWLTHEHVADNHTYLDEYSVLKDMGTGLGRIALCLLVALIAALASFHAAIIVAFAIAALAGVGSLYLAQRHTRAAF